ncbi:hypothetical protein [Leptospira bouyouniensis]|nr:hypothetical protein [Leptospira bouyouniensis]
MTRIKNTKRYLIRHLSVAFPIRDETLDSHLTIASHDLPLEQRYVI